VSDSTDSVPSQGGRAGATRAATAATWTDETTGARVHRLTDALSHSHHLYFPQSGWFDDGSKLVLGSDRGGAPNLHVYDFDRDEVTRLTDFPRPTADIRVNVSMGMGASVNPEREEAYCWHDRTLLAVDLETCDVRPIHAVDDGQSPLRTSVAADGAAIYTGVTEGRADIDASTETFEASPHSAVLRVPLDGGDPETIHEIDRWLGHVNAAPTRPELLTVAHEGPWEAVEQRIWGIDADTGEVWPVREQTPEEGIGHEHWIPDAERVGYHGFDADGSPFYGHVRYDDTDRVEVSLPTATVAVGAHGDQSHFHGRDETLAVSDGTEDLPYCLLWRVDPETETVQGPRVLCRHDGSFRHQKTHVHPRFGPGGRVLFTTDHSEYGNVHVVDTPDFESLPALDAI
jgi:oligogalacturonide lyase